MKCRASSFQRVRESVCTLVAETRTQIGADLLIHLEDLELEEVVPLEQKAKHFPRRA